MKTRSLKHTLVFKRPSGTSRGVLKTKDSWLVLATEGARLRGIGEASIIEGLSPESSEDMDEAVLRALSNWQRGVSGFTQDQPAVRFGLEMLDKSVSTGDPFVLFPSSFTAGIKGIPINGLIWMGTKDFMLEQIKAKLAEGYRCIKLKIGAIDFAEELRLLSYVRRQFNEDDVTLRVDANGAFHPSEALEKLSRLSEYQLHSIEQPIRQGQWEDMARLCAQTPLPIALDEELIGISDLSTKVSLLDIVRPQYIILKPSLLGGWAASEEWVQLADERNIGWWATSALESNIGLNAIAQWVATLNTTMPQGLGTGALYTNNIDSPLVIKEAKLWHLGDEIQNSAWNIDLLL